MIMFKVFFIKFKVKNKVSEGGSAQKWTHGQGVNKERVRVQSPSMAIMWDLFARQQQEEEGLMGLV